MELQDLVEAKMYPCGYSHNATFSSAFLWFFLFLTHESIVLDSGKICLQLGSHLHDNVANEIGDHGGDDQVDLARSRLQDQRLWLEGRYEVVVDVLAEQKESGQRKQVLKIIFDIFDYLWSESACVK